MEDTAMANPPDIADDQCSSEDEGVPVFLSKKPVDGPTEDKETSVEETVNQGFNGLDEDNCEPRMIVDDSDDDNNINRSLSIGRRNPVLLLSDEDEEDIDDPVHRNSNSSSDEEVEEDRPTHVKKQKQRIVQRIDSDNDDELDILLRPKSSHYSPGKPKPSFKYNSDLFDTELSDEDPAQSNSHPHSPIGDETLSQNKSSTSSGKKQSKKSVKPKEPTMKQRQKEAQEIHSESQRMVRESEISLPYHRPKQRTLAEFLNRRKKTAIPERSKGGSLKMSMKSLETLRMLEERKKEVQEFYKSESDEEEDPDDDDWKPENEKDQASKDSSDMNEVATDPSEATGEKNETTNYSSDILKNDELPAVTNDLDSLEPKVSKSGDGNTDDVQMRYDSGVYSGDSSPMEVNQAKTGTEDNEGIEISNENPVKKVINQLKDDTEVADSTQENITNIIKFTDSEPMRNEISCALSETETSQIPSSTKKHNKQNIVFPKDPSLLTKAPTSASVDTCTEMMELPDLVSGQSYEAEPVVASNSDVTRSEGPKSDSASAEDPNTITAGPKYNAEDPQSHLETSKLNAEGPKLSLLASRFPNLDLSTTPRLSLGGEGDVIDLEEDDNGTPKGNMAGVMDLMNRFVKHSSTKRRKPTKKQQVNLNIVSKEKNDEGVEKLVASDLIVTIDSEDEEKPRESVPGAGLVSLKTALRARIREHREEQRLRRVHEKQFLETEQVVQDYQDVFDLPDEEAELSDRSDTEYETESEPEENDVIISDKKHKKNKYLDEEAEEDDIDGDDDVGDGGDGDDGGDDSDGGDENDVGPEDKDEASNDTVDIPPARKRIIQDDDEEENEDEDEGTLRLHLEDTQDVNSNNLPQHSSSSTLSRANTEDLFASQHPRKGSECVDRDNSMTSMDSSFELFGSVIPGHQPGGGLRRLSNASTRRSDSESEHPAFLTPFTKTKSAGFGSSKDRDLSLPLEDPEESFTNSAAAPSPTPSTDLSLHLTPMKDSQFPQDSQKDSGKVRLDFRGIDGSQDKDELVGLCSGQFTGKVTNPQVQDLCEDSLAPTQDIRELMGLCSGQFSEGKEVEKRRGFGGTTQEGGISNLSKLITSQGGSDHEEDDLLGLCTGKFTSQEAKDMTTEMNAGDKNDSEAENNIDDAEPDQQMVIYSSDEEEEVKRERIKRKKKRKRIMELSDDEDAQDAIEFDEDENEIPQTVFSGFKDKVKGGIRADFLENEAELSGSEYGSGDEDEADQDMMEEEEADREYFDQNELRNQVGRAHLKNVLDSDKREIRLLQEMYLEDGELHGEGRQRQFRWKNLNKLMDDNDERRVLSDNEGEPEEDTEGAEWRKIRIEREKLIEEQKKKTEETKLDLFSTKRAIVRNSSVSVESPREPLKPANPVQATTQQQQQQPKLTRNICLAKRGSFLSRDKNTLARIAELTKDKSGVVGGAKQAGNFVFQQLSAEEAQAKESRLKRTQSVPNAKKARLERSFFSLDPSKQSSSIFKHF